MDAASRRSARSLPGVLLPVCIDPAPRFPQRLFSDQPPSDYNPVSVLYFPRTVGKPEAVRFGLDSDWPPACHSTTALVFSQQRLIGRAKDGEPFTMYGGRQ